MNSEKHNIFRYNDHSLSYLQAGHGDELILAFHGFGMDRNAFISFHRLIQPHQKLISIDLFDHGESKSADYSGLTKNEWKILISSFLAHIGHTNFSLLAYSLGGKVALETVNLFPERVRQLILLAPDGFKKNRYYEFLSLSSFGRWTYRRIINHPKTFLKFTDFLTHIKILSPKLKKFVHHHIGDSERRELVYDVYRVYRHFIPDLHLFQRNIESNKISISFIFGKHDVIIHHSLAQRFIDRLQNKDLAKKYLLDKGHVILDDQTAEFILKTGLWFG